MVDSMDGARWVKVWRLEGRRWKKKMRIKRYVELATSEMVEEWKLLWGFSRGTWEKRKINEYSFSQGIFSFRINLTVKSIPNEFWNSIPMKSWIPSEMPWSHQTPWELDASDQAQKILYHVSVGIIQLVCRGTCLETGPRDELFCLWSYH